MMPVGANDYVQLVQTRDYVVIYTELVQDARIVPLDGRPHLPDHLRQWRGDSRGQWDGDTLVVTTKNFPKAVTGVFWLQPTGEQMVGQGTLDENAVLIERFRRLNSETLLYEYTVTDPTVWTKQWTMSIPMSRSQDQRIYEYACHEGNYGMAGILSGARAAEKRSVPPK